MKINSVKFFFKIYTYSTITVLAVLVYYSSSCSHPFIADQGFPSVQFPVLQNCVPCTLYSSKRSTVWLLKVLMVVRNICLLSAVCDSHPSRLCVPSSTPLPAMGSMSGCWNPCVHISRICHALIIELLSFSVQQIEILCAIFCNWNLHLHLPSPVMGFVWA